MKRLVLLAVILGLTGLSFAQDSNTDQTTTDQPDQSTATSQETSGSTTQDIPAQPATAAPSTPAQSTPAQATPAPSTTAPATAAPTQTAAPAPAQTPTAPQGSAQPAPGAETKPGQRVQAAATVLQEIMGTPDKGVPEEVMASAQCVAVVPSLLKGGFVLGARYGRGVASCRTPKGWSAPAFFSVKGGSVGFQIGGQAVDLVMLIMNEKGMRELLSSKFQVGGDASAAAGPVGRHAEAGTDWKMRSEILTYSRARGIFAGVSLAGAVITQDKDSTREFYGRMVPFRTSLTGQIEAPAAAYPFLSTLSNFARESAAR